MNGETLSTRFAYHYDLTLSLALPGPEFSAEDRRTLENGSIPIMKDPST